jgi:hypothetical protein
MASLDLVTVVSENAKPEADQNHWASVGIEAEHGKNHSDSIEARCGVTFELSKGGLTISSNSVV